MPNSVEVAVAAGGLLRPATANLPGTHNPAIGHPQFEQFQGFGREDDTQVEEVLSAMLRVLRPS